jgi:23S rRNA pseudouridine1911/1915/1917 synthase
MLQKTEKFNVDRELLLTDFLREIFPQSSGTKIKKLLVHGSISVNGKISRNPTTPLHPGDVVGYRKQVILTGEVAPFPLVYEDPHILVIDKPAGLLTYGEKGSNGTSVYKDLKDYLSKTVKARAELFVIHRLDREVSGLLIFARTAEIQEIIKENWVQNVKRYLAFVEGIPDPPEGTIRSWLSEGEGYKVHSVGKREGAKYAVTNYKLIQVKDRNALLEISLETGRKNQIRVHLSDIGHPVIGDRKYGADASYERRIRLHACYLKIMHPVTNDWLEFNSGLPKGFLSLKPQDEKYK